MVGHKIVIYIKDESFNVVMEEIRALMFEFVRNDLGASIIELTVDEFDEHESKLTPQSIQKLIEVAGQIFTKDVHGFAKQNAIIVFIENFNENEESPALRFICDNQNFELNIKITQKVTINTAKQYINEMKDRIKYEKLTHITLENSNSFFRKRPDLGFEVSQFMKQQSGAFKYLMPLANDKNQISLLSVTDNINLLKLNPLNVRSFKNFEITQTCYAPIDKDKVLLLSIQELNKITIELIYR